MKHSLIIIAALITSMLLGACGLTGTPDPAAPADTAPDAAPGEVVTISFMAQEWERSLYEPLIETFNAENPGIRVQFISNDEVEGAGFGPSVDANQRMRRIVSAADTAAVFSISTEDIANGYLFDLAPLMEADPTFARDDFFPGVLESASQNGGIYMLPSIIRVMLVSYNKDLWIANGLPDPDPDWQWNDMIAAAEQLAQKRGDDVAVYGFFSGSNGFLELIAEAASAGIDLLATPVEAFDLEQPELVTAVERVAALAESGAIFVDTGEETDSFNPNDTQRLILDQRAGMWNADFLLFGQADEEPQFEVGTLPFPALSTPLFSNTQGYIMSSGTQHPEAAWRWLEFLSRQQLESSMNPDSPSQVPARQSVAESSGYWANLDEETAAAVRAALAQPMRPIPPAMFSGPNIFQLLNEALIAVVNGEQTAAEALREAQASLEEQLAAAQLTPEPTPAAGPIVVATPVPDIAPEGATTITFRTPGFGAGELRRVVREFNQTNGEIFVEVADIDVSEGPVTFAGVAASADCFSWFGYPDTEAITATLDLQPLIDADASFDINDYPPALLAPFRHETGLYGLPHAVDFRTLNYNQTAFDTAGLAYPTIDWTLDDLLNAAQQLTTGTGQNRQYGYISAGAQTDELFFFLQRFGVSPVRGEDETLQPAFTDPDVLRAVQFYVELLRDFSPNSQLQGYTRSGIIFGSNLFDIIMEGRAGMWLDSGSSFFLSGPDTDPDVQIAIAPPPLGDSPIGPQDFRARGLYISATTQQPEACWTWLKYLTEDTSLLEGSFPARTSVAESEAFAAQARPGAAEVFAAYRTLLDETPQSERETETFYRQPIDYYWFFRAVDQALQGEVDLEEGLAEAQRLTEDFLACVRNGTEAEVCAPQVDPDYNGFNQPPEE